MAATLLGEAAILSPVPDSQSYQETGTTCRHQQVLNDTSHKADVLSGFVELYKATQIHTAINSYSGQQDHEQFHDTLLCS